MAKRNLRVDHEGSQRRAYEKNRKRILATQSVCGICGGAVDKSLKFPDPMAPVVDHILPISKGGHPSDLNNLQLAHNICNRLKSDKIKRQARADATQEPDAIPNNILPWSCDWYSYRGDE